MGTVEPDGPKHPNFWELLDDQDKARYEALKTALDLSSGKRNRGHRVEAFDNVLEAIHKFAERHDENDWRRFLVCGVCWMDNMIAINTRQLRLLISKCKSSINGSFQKLGYTTNPSHTESWKFLNDKIPILKENFQELRQWTIRSRVPGNQPLVAYADRKACIVPEDPCQPIRMQINVPQFSQAAMRNDSQPVQLNLLIPQSVIDSRINQGAILQAQNIQPQMIQMQPSIQTAQVHAPAVLPPMQPSETNNEINPQPLPVDGPNKNSKGADENVEQYCPLKFRLRQMHRQSSKEGNN